MSYLTSGDLHWWSSLPVGVFNGVWQYRKFSVAVFLCGGWKQRISGICLFMCVFVCMCESWKWADVYYMTLNVEHFEDCWLKEDHLVTSVTMSTPLGHKRSNEYSTYLQGQQHIIHTYVHNLQILCHFAKLVFLEVGLFPKPTFSK
jgi:hypothetical protein